MWSAGENHSEVLGGNPESGELAKERNRPEGLLPFVCAESCVSRLVHMQVNSRRRCVDT